MVGIHAQREAPFARGFIQPAAGIGDEPGFVMHLRRFGIVAAQHFGFGHGQVGAGLRMGRIQLEQPLEVLLGGRILLTL